MLPCLLGVRGFGKWPPYIWKPLICGYVAAGAFFFQKNGPHISGSPELVGTLPQALFFPEEWPPHISESPELVGMLPRALFFFSEKGPQMFDMSSG